MTRGRVCAAGALALTVGLATLAAPPHEHATWETLLAPYSTGAQLPDGFRIQDIHRGAENDVVIAVGRADEAATIEVVVVERGRWESDHQSQSFAIEYEVPHSPAPEREAVTELLAATIRSHDHGLPSPDAVPLRAGDPGVLPWWIEMLRGVRGVLFGASLILIALIALHGSTGLAWAGVALAVTDVAARLAGVTLLRPDIGAAWTLPAAAVLLLLALRGRRWTRGDIVPAVAVAAPALLLRVALGPWGPLHVNGQGPRFVAGATYDPADIAAYGPGYREMFAPVAALLPSSPDWAVFACNALLSALLIPLAFAIGRLTGLATSAALVAAALLAIDPVAIRMGATEAYFVSIAFLGTAASATLLLAVEVGDRVRATALVVAAGLLLAEAARIHPCAWVLMATVPFVVLAADAGRWRRRVGMLVFAGAISGGVLLLTSASALLDVLGNMRAGTIFTPEPPSPAPLLWLALATAVYVMLSARRRLALPAAICVAAMLMTHQAFDASWIWEQSYFRLYLTLPVIAAVACIPTPLLRRRAVVLVAAPLLVLAWIRFGLPIVAARTTEQLEYRWVRTQLERLPSECRVIHVVAAGKRALTLPTYVRLDTPAVAMDLRQPGTIEAALSPAACVYYVHSSLCSTTDGRPECAAIERRLTLAPVARTSLAAAREIETFSHDGGPVEVSIARVERVD